MYSWADIFEGSEFFFYFWLYTFDETSIWPDRIPQVSVGNAWWLEDRRVVADRLSTATRRLAVELLDISGRSQFLYEHGSRALAGNPSYCIGQYSTLSLFD